MPIKRYALKPKREPKYASTGGNGRYKLNLFLLRVTAEDAAQNAISHEITRQLKTQGINAIVKTCVFDIDMNPNAHVVVEGKPVEWVDECL
jgi:hypothetical protein